MALRFVQPETVRLPLSDGEWIEIKKELNAQEHRDMLGRTYNTVVVGEPLTRRPEMVERATVAAYLVGWSLAVTYSEDALMHLDVESFNAIYQAIAAHETALEQEKNALAGATVS